MAYNTTRRGFLVGAGATAFLLVGTGTKGIAATANPSEATFNPFVKIGSDGSVTAIVKHFEKGQGPATGLPTLIAEELGVSMGQITYEFAPSNPELYANLAFGKFQGTGGSTAMANSFMQYRQAGAAAREMLLDAASNSWQVEKASLKIVDGMIVGAGKSAPMREFVEDASKLSAPANPPLKEAKDFKLIGNPSVRRLDTEIKTNGRALYSMDVYLPNQMVAVIKRPARKDGVVISFDDAAASSVKGFINASTLPNKAGVVVYAENTWAAFKAREALVVQWDMSKAENRSSEQIKSEILAALDAEPQYNVLKNEPASFENADKTIERTFYFPLLAHAPMEPLNCTIESTPDGGVRLHDGCQFPTGPHGALAQILQVPFEKVQINTMLAGGSFGRRATPSADYQVEAALAFSMTDRKRPVKLVWSREDDITGGYYRPAFGHKVRVGLNKNGDIVAWDHRIAGQSIMKGTAFEAFSVHDGIDGSSVEGVSDTLYQIPGQFVGLTDTPKATSLLWWRSVGHTHTAYAMEVMMDMAASAAGEDPLKFRLKYLNGGDEQERMRGVLELAAEKANWGEVSDGRSQGIAVHKSFGSYVAEVVEISGNAQESVKVEKVTCAVDCGIAVNPDIIKAQMEGGIGYGIGHVMRDQITLVDGEVEQLNFPDYEPLRISDIAQIGVHIVPSQQPPTGVGEPGTPPSAPALANAIAAASNDFVVSKLPMSENGVSFA